MYKDVTIDEEVLDTLPEDDILDSIIVRDGASAQDVALAASEGVGYTRQDDEENENNEDEIVGDKAVHDSTRGSPGSEPV